MAKLRSALGLVAAFALCIILIGLVAACAGCATDPETGDVTIRVPAAAVDFATNAVREYLEGLEEAAKDSAQADSSGAAESGPPATAEGEAATSQPREEPEAVALQLDFRYGGFKGGGAKEVPGCRIGSFRMSLDGMSYRWLSGGCEALGATSREDYDHTVACAFFWDGNKWVGGKFDWVSTSRTYRDFENIRTGYGGWDAVSFFRATKHAFCIVSADGKKRSNLIED